MAQSTATYLNVEPFHLFRYLDEQAFRQTLFFLPDYGCPNGMVVVGTAPPDLAIDSELAQAAKRTGVFCSFINLEKYERFDEATFAEALEDWKYPYEKPPVET